jgi:hypothetical protein
MSIYTLNSVSATQESTRLDLQHNVFLHMTNTLLPPEMQKYLSTIKTPRIADVATGTGVWLKALSSLFPSATLDGYDFDITKFPPQEEEEEEEEEESKTRGNITLSFANVLDISTFPEACLGSYDVVHVRLLMYGLKASQWTLAAANLQKLLKPGGWLLWEETGYHSWVALPPSKTWHRILETDIRHVLAPYSERRAQGESWAIP